MGNSVKLKTKKFFDYESAHQEFEIKLIDEKIFSFSVLKII